MKHRYNLQNSDRHDVAPLWERGLKRYNDWQNARYITVAPLWERGLKHFPELPALSGFSVAPLWERGLKLDVPPFLVGAGESLPYGSVD